MKPTARKNKLIVKILVTYSRIRAGFFLRQKQRVNGYQPSHSDN